MDKKLIVAKAGSGKTTYIINQINQSRNTLIITYQVKNMEQLKSRIIDKYGFLPTNIYLTTYYSFLYNICLKPNYLEGVSGINYTEDVPLYEKGISRYKDKNNYFYSIRLGEYIVKFHLTDVIEKIFNNFDEIFVDEVQDFSGYDMELITSISDSVNNTTFVGDYFQSTVATSRSNKNSHSHKTYENWKQYYIEKNFIINDKLLLRSYRCSIAICNYITKTLGITIEGSHKNGEVFEVLKYDDSKIILNNTYIKKLLYKNSVEYGIDFSNWGEVKGVEYENIAVIKTKTFDKTKSELTKKKYYVACTRPRQNLYIIDYKHFEQWLKK